MKTLLKAALLGVGASVLLLLGALLLAPFLLKDRVIELVERQISERLEATVGFEDVELSLLSTFPALTIEVVGLKVVGAGEFEGVTLASVQSLRAGVDLGRLVRDDQLLIESATVDQPEIYLIVDEDGEANYDIIKAADEEEEIEAKDEPGALTIRLQRYEITGGRIEYDAPGAEVSLEGLEHQGSALVDGATYTVASSTTVESLTVRIGNVRYISEARARFDLGGVLHADDERLDVERLEVAFNELTGEAKGTIEWRDGRVELHLGLALGKGQSIRALVSAIPGAYAGDITGLQASGRYSIRAKVKGRLSRRDDHAPSFSASLFVRNGTLQHADRSLPLTNIDLDAKVKHPGGHLDKMVIDVPRFSARAGQSHVTGRFAVATPISRPRIALTVDGRFDLAEVAKAYPVADAADLRGTVGVKLELAAKGERVERLTGWMTATALAYRPEDAPHVEVSAASVSFTPKATRVDALYGAYGKSDLAIQGSLSPVNVLLLDDEPFVGDLRLESRSIYLDEILEGESVEIPEILDITIAAKAKKLMRKKLVLPDMRGVVLIKDGDWSLTNVRSDAGRKDAEALLSSLKGDAILAPSGSRHLLIPPPKVR
jgi:hypothetical protein